MIFLGMSGMSTGVRAKISAFSLRSYITSFFSCGSKLAPILVILEGSYSAKITASISPSGLGRRSSSFSRGSTNSVFMILEGPLAGSSSFSAGVARTACSANYRLDSQESPPFLAALLLWSENQSCASPTTMDGKALHITSSGAPAVRSFGIVNSIISSVNGYFFFLPAFTPGRLQQILRRNLIALFQTPMSSCLTPRFASATCKISSAQPYKIWFSAPEMSDATFCCSNNAIITSSHGYGAFTETCSGVFFGPSSCIISCAAFLAASAASRAVV
ncbi:uncharacterized protein G2W53_041888 [Senna tora]|uniref:Uncharacterized protein n=1 Tax=Senna tora TaxID=362788 RepID=A0A834VZ41_9FABA|nr:uncharacterized protein G2W53_041888 [Senna tora]